MSKLLGIDYGLAKCGLALADSETKTAIPFKTLSYQDLIPGGLKDLIEAETIEKIIVGLPLGLNGQETQQTKEALAFINQIKSIFKIEVIAEDERLTSVQAQNIGKDDAVAAMYILQSYLDRIN
jgi:putative Holliday junction resolvase